MEHSGSGQPLPGGATSWHVSPLNGVSSSADRASATCESRGGLASGCTASILALLGHHPLRSEREPRLPTRSEPLHLHTVYRGQVSVPRDDENGGCSGGTFHAAEQLSGAGSLETGGIWATGSVVPVLPVSIAAGVTSFLGPPAASLCKNSDCCCFSPPPSLTRWP